MILITPSISIAEDEISWEFVRASGPGGQNVNKVSTAAQLRFDVAKSASLPDAVKQRLVRLAGRRMTDDGVLVIDARRYRSRQRNRDDAVSRLTNLIQTAAEAPKARRKTKPTAASRRRRLDAKRRRSETKQLRGRVEPQ